MYWCLRTSDGWCQHLVSWLFTGSTCVCRFLLTTCDSLKYEGGLEGWIQRWNPIPWKELVCFHCSLRFDNDNRNRTAHLSFKRINVDVTGTKRRTFHHWRLTCGSMYLMATAKHLTSVHLLSQPALHSSHRHHRLVPEYCLGAEIIVLLKLFHMFKLTKFKQYYETNLLWKVTLLWPYKYHENKRNHMDVVIVFYLFTCLKWNGLTEQEAHWQEWRRIIAAQTKKCMFLCKYAWAATRSADDVWWLRWGELFKRYSDIDPSRILSK